jgi:hypothetical protein
MITASILAPLMLPVLSPDNYVAYMRRLGLEPTRREVHEHGLLPQPFGDQMGWRELAGQVAQVYNRLPPEEQARTAILTGNYGEAGAIDMFGPNYGLPGSPQRTPDLLLLGYPRVHGKQSHHIAVWLERSFPNVRNGRTGRAAF